MTIREFAPAKINLALHVTGQRSDGFHELDSLVCFADVGDWLTISPADRLSLTVSGSNTAALPVAGDNLVMRAANLMSGSRGALINLEKHLPVSAGIGGGSSDAAACLRALAKQWGSVLPTAEMITALGADVPVCLLGQTARMCGIGADLTLVPQLPVFDAVLVNPCVAVATVDVFNQLTQKNNPEMSDFPASPNPSEWIDFLARQRNDLQGSAIKTAPVIRDILARLQATEACQIARMSGSGATCFAIYPDAIAAQKAAKSIVTANPNWWVQITRLGL